MVDDVNEMPLSGSSPTTFDAHPIMATNPSPDGLAKPQRTLAFATVMLAVTMAVLDGSIVNVALPSIAADQAVSPAHAIWVVTAYQLSIVVSLLPLAALGEAVGFRKIYLAGILLCAFAGVLCAEAPATEVLVGAGVVQGLGAAAIMSINSALVRHIMPRDRLGRGISWVAMTVAVSAAAGPTIAAAILSAASWHWLFLINVPLSVVALALGFVSLPRTASNGVRFDGLSALLNALAFGGLVIALGSLGSEAHTGLVIAELAPAVVAGVLLVLCQLSRPSPMLPIDLLRRPRFAMAMGSSLLAFCAQFVAFVSLPFYFHDVLGYSEVHTGLMLTAWPAATALVAPIAGRLVDRYSARPLTTAGMLIFACGLALTTLVSAKADASLMVGAQVLAGAGFGLFQSPNNHDILTLAPRERSGAASGLQSTARLLGQSTGAALAAVLIGTGGHFDLRPSLWTGAGFGTLSPLLGALRGAPSRPPQDEAMDPSASPVSGWRK